MKEKTKTLTFVAVAAAVVIVAVVGRPSLPVANIEDALNKLLYPDFKDPLAVTSLKIVEYDDNRGEVHPFRVAQVDVDGKPRWSIPSHDDYPADAKDQVALAASGLMGLKVLEVVSDNLGDQREYGVVDPDPKVLKIGDTGVGEQVVMKDKDGKELLALVIGKEVPDRPGLRYVRKVGEAPIYIVAAKTDKLSTTFEDWIERNLLGINTFDIKRLWIRDYSVDEYNGTLNQRSDMEIEYDDTGEPKWRMVDDLHFVIDDKQKEGRWEPVIMAPDEELNVAKLDELKTALDDLKIIDISRKPEGLSAELKAADDFTNNPEAVESLGRKGFFVAKMNDQVGLYSNEGEIRVVMKDGVQYVLRFGAIAGSGASKKSKDGESDQAKQPGSDVNRYLFVMVEFSPDVIPKPEFEPLPVENNDKEKTPEEQKAFEAEHERIEKENKRKQEEFEQKIADGKKRMAELNDRFADWYYIIADNVFHKIHLSRDEVFEKKASAEKPTEEPATDQAQDTAETTEEPPAEEPQDEHAGHDDAKEEPIPSEKPETMKEEGPEGEK